MVERISKKVILRKPRLDITKQIDLTPVSIVAKNIDISDPIYTPGIKKSRKQIKSHPEVLQEKENILTEEELNIPDVEEITGYPDQTEPYEILKTASNKIIIATEIKPEPSEPIKTFDDQFLDKIVIRSTISKDSEMLDKLQKPKIKPFVKSKIKTKQKFNPFIPISFAIFCILILWTYVTLQNYPVDSLAAFLYVASSVILTIISLIWFSIELLFKTRRE
jgi:hypothetical protein